MCWLPQRRRRDRKEYRPHGDDQRLRGLPHDSYVRAGCARRSFASGRHCASCHNGTTAPGKRAGHIATSNTCENCHTTSAWTPANFDHDNITGSCASCHNGVAATGKSPGHIATTNVCEDCHSVVAFVPAVTVDHTQVVGSCSGCHNGVTATGKNSTHLARWPSATSATRPPAFLPATFDHSNVTPGTCSSCHNGTTSTGKPVNHFTTQSSATIATAAAWGADDIRASVGKLPRRPRGAIDLRRLPHQQRTDRTLAVPGIRARLRRLPRVRLQAEPHQNASVSAESRLRRHLSSIAARAQRALARVVGRADANGGRHHKSVRHSRFRPPQTRPANSSRTSKLSRSGDTATVRFDLACPRCPLSVGSRDRGRRADRDPHCAARGLRRRHARERSPRPEWPTRARRRGRIRGAGARRELARRPVRSPHTVPSRATRRLAAARPRRVRRRRNGAGRECERHAPNRRATRAAAASSDTDGPSAPHAARA